MASISQLSSKLRLLHVLKISKAYSPVIIRHGSYWNHDWKPGPYPRTEEERAAAAKRYGLLPEDYEPFPDDGNAPGDYPNLQPMAAHNRDLFEYYEHRLFTRHYGEPMPLFANLYRPGYIDPNDPNKWYVRMPLWKQITYFLTSVLTLWFLLVIVGPQYKYFTPVMAKQFPYDKKGQKHYLFEPAE